METTAPIKNDPHYKAAADFIAAKFKALQSIAAMQQKGHIKGKHTALAWMVQPDGTLTVILESGPKLNEEMPSMATIKQGVSALIKSIEDPTGENDTMLQQREAQLNQRENLLNLRIAEVEAMQRDIQAQMDTFREKHPEATEATPPTAPAEADPPAEGKPKKKTS